MFTELSGLLRRLAHQAEGRSPEASACVIDAQSIKTSANVPAGQGVEAAKKIVGRKRGIATDTLGLLPAVPAVLVTAAGVQDSVAGTSLLDRFAPPAIPASAKPGSTAAIGHFSLITPPPLGIDAQVVSRAPAIRGFTVLPLIHPLCWPGCLPPGSNCRYLWIGLLDQVGG